MPMDNILQIIAIIVAVQGAFKAFDYFVEKINKKHDNEQKIGENADSLEEYIKKNDKEIAELKKAMNDAHLYASDGLKTMENNLTSTLKNHKEEYMERIQSVENSILEMQAVYQQTVAVVDIKIENLEKSQTAQLEALTRETQKHNSVIERTFICEKEIAVLNQRETASEKRIRELEDAK